MGNKWIIDVLSDLQAYAALNGLPHVADQIAQSLVVARLECAVVPDTAALLAVGDMGEAGQFSSRTGTSGRA